MTETYVVRVWLPDRPGALGQVASRIGAVRGDVVGIEILEQGGGRAVDELIVTLPEPGLVDMLVKEVNEVDDVDVEDVRPMRLEQHDHRLAAVYAASRIAEAPDRDAVLTVLCESTSDDLEGDWAAVIRLDGSALLASVGEPPKAQWLAAFVEGSRHSATVTDGRAGPGDLAWGELLVAGAALVVGRRGRPLRWRERRQLAALARIADAVLARL